MINLTALILAFDEKENIGRTLAALTWLEKVVVLDSFSTDGTADIARGYPNVHLVQRRFDNHTAQWNYGLDEVRTPWVLSLDADYEVSPALADEIRLLEPAEPTAGYTARFEFRVFGHRLRASVYPPRVVLFRRDRARYQPDGHTQLLQTEGPILPLRNLIWHDDRKPLSRWLRSQDNYMVIESRHLLASPSQQLRRQDRLRLRVILAPGVIFCYLLFARGLILDGWPGWFYVLQRTLAETLLALRLLVEREKLEP